MYLLTMLVVAIQLIGGGQDGGEDAVKEAVSPEDVPYVVIVLFNNNKYFCSGTLVQDDCVLTSAHCMYDTFGVFTEVDTSITVIAGASSLKDATKEIASGKAQSRQSEKIIVHAYFSWLKNFVNDLALVKVSPPFNLTQRVGVAPMLVNNDSKGRKDDHDDCVGYGFGIVRNDKTSQEDFYLKKQEYSVGKDCNCLLRISTTRMPYSITVPRNTFACDQGRGSSGPCSGDNGSPLVCGGRVRGVTAALFPYQDKQSCRGLNQGPVRCQDPQTLVVFTDLCYYSHWLHQFVTSGLITDENCTLVHRSLTPLIVTYTDF